MKKILLLFMVVTLCFSLTACTEQITSESTLSSSMADTSAENMNEGDGMKHEILTVKTIDDNELIAVNDKNEKYLIVDYTQFGIDFETGQKIGISYLKKNKNNDGEYELESLKVTKEGTITIAPVEK